MIDTDKYEGHTCKWCGYVEDTHAWHYEECPIFDDPMMKHHIAEVKQLREENDLLRSMQRDGIEASAHDNWLGTSSILLSEINRLREDNEKLHDAINRSFHAKISGSALEIYNGWWEGEEE